MARPHSLMTDSKRLRERALARLREAAGPPADRSPSYSDAVGLLEDLRIHKAELEIQNQELQESQARAEAERERYQHLFERLPIAAIVVDRIGVIRSANPVAARYFGFRGVSALEHHSFFRLIDSGDAPRVASVIGEGEERPAGTLRSITLAGRDGHTLTDLALISLGDGYHLDRRVLIVIHDRHEEQEREHDRQLYETLLDNSPSVIYAFGRDDRCLLWNARAARVFGTPRAAAIGALRKELLSPAEAERGRQLDRRVVEEARALTDEVRLSGVDDIRAPHIETRFPLRHSREGIFGVGVIAGNISELTRVRSRLEVAMRVFNQGGEGIAILDDSLRVTFCNLAFQEMLGREERDLLGRRPLRFLAKRRQNRKLAIIRKALDEYGRWQGERWVRNPGGKLFPCWLRVALVRDSEGAASNFIVIANDITQQKSAEEEIERLAYYDALTGMANRYLLKNRARQVIQAAKSSNGEFALLFIDLDKFKDVNDAFGHACGDRLLVQFARRLTAQVRERDMVCRLGGDEFVILLSEISRDEVSERVESLLSNIVRSFSIDGEELHLSASLGIAMYPSDADDFDGLLKSADAAMYQAKAAGRNTYRFFDAAMAEAVASHARMQQALHRAINIEGALSVVYQPQIDLAGGRLVGLEALLRWCDPELGQVSPEEFIPMAEQSGLIRELSDFVLDTVIEQIKDWRGGMLGDAIVSVNITPEQFWHDDFESDLLGRIERAGIPADHLLLEITERTAMKDPEGLVALMNSLRTHGIELSIDDFGTGFSSLAYLQRFPLRQLKIDMSFVQGLGSDVAAEQICQSVLNLAHTLGLEVVAEGIETEIQARRLRDWDCEIGQGFLYARPMSPDRLMRWLDSSEFTSLGESATGAE